MVIIFQHNKMLLDIGQEMYLGNKQNKFKLIFLLVHLFGHWFLFFSIGTVGSIHIYLSRFIPDMYSYKGFCL